MEALIKRYYKLSEDNRKKFVRKVLQEFVYEPYVCYTLDALATTDREQLDYLRTKIVESYNGETAMRELYDVCLYWTDMHKDYGVDMYSNDTILNGLKHIVANLRMLQQPLARRQLTFRWNDTYRPEQQAPIQMRDFIKEWNSIIDKLGRKICNVPKDRP